MLLAAAEAVFDRITRDASSDSETGDEPSATDADRVHSDPAGEIIGRVRSGMRGANPEI